MIGVDTNVLVRYMAQDDRDPIENCDGFDRAAAYRERSRLYKHRCHDRDGLGSRTRYGLSGVEIARAIERTLQTDVLVVESEQEIFTATVALREGRGSFATL